MLLVALLSACANKKTAKSTVAVVPPPSARSWIEVATPFPAADITAQGDLFWVCGANEMVAFSNDGGTTWTLTHHKDNGAVLLQISFIDKRVGHSVGTQGLLLSTVNGGRSWTEQHAATDIQAFSFADAKNGIAVFGGEDDFSPHLDGVVKVTHDGGQTWSDIAALRQNELRPYSQVLSVAALDAGHYLMVRRQPDIEDVFVVSIDGGDSWKVVHPRNDSTNREFPRQIFVQGREYWAFGMELVNRNKRGGYGVPMTLHSKDGESWSHAVNGGLHEFQGCNQQGCYLYDGTAEISYTNQPRYWAMPQDFSLSKVWAVAGNRACTITAITQCGPAAVTDQPQPRVWRPGGMQFQLKLPKPSNLAFADDCVACGVTAIWPDPGIDWRGSVVADIDVAADGAVENVLLEGTSTNSFVDAQIRDQLARWKFQPPRRHGTQKRNVPLDVRCQNLPQVPAIGGCWLTPPKNPS